MLHRHPARSRLALPLRSRSPLLPSSFPLSLPPPSPANLPPPSPQLVGRHVSGEQYSPAISSPAVLLLPSLFIKLPKQKSVAVVTWRSAQLADPACRPSCSVRAPSSPAGPRPSGSSLVLHRLHLLPALGAVHPQRLEP